MQKSAGMIKKGVRQLNEESQVKDDYFPVLAEV